MSQTAAVDASAKRERFPRFPDEYRARWASAGMWRDLTLHGVFDETAAATPDAVALITKDERITFREWKERSDALAAGLRAAGIGAGDVVTVQLPNVAEFCYLQVALSRLGAVIHPMHVVYREREMESLLRFCESDAVVVPASSGGFAFADAVRGMRERLPALRLLVVAGEKGEGEGEVGLEDLVDDGRSAKDTVASAEDPDAVFYLNFTSGTEGDPKGFLHTHNTLISYMKGMVDFVKMAMPEAVVLTCSPMTHSFGHFLTYFASLGGRPVVLVARYRAGDVLEHITSERVTMIAGTPAHLSGILNHPDFDRFDTSSVKHVMTGGARSAPEMLEQLERTWGVRPSNTYGLGENLVHTQTTAFDPPDKARDTVGRPVPGAELRIVDPDDHTRELPAGAVGEIAYRGPTLFLGYHRQPELTAATRDDDGWFFTGDLGFVDEDGYLHFASRRSEVINRGGTKIYPKEIEDLLAEHPDVADVAVLGMPDRELGERVCAYVVPRTGSTVTLDDLARFLLDQKVSKHKVPEHLVVVDELPLTPTGKVRKVSLQEDIAQRVSAQGDTARGVS